MGSDHTGEDIEAGRTTRAENRTVIWAQTEKGSDFDGDDSRGRSRTDRRGR